MPNFRITSRASAKSRSSPAASSKKSLPPRRNPHELHARMTTKPRVLLLSASSGAGHVRASQALEKAFAARGDCVVEHVDVIQHVSKMFQRLYDKAYISMVRRAPELMGLLYNSTDHPWQRMRQRLVVDRLNTRPMIQLLKRAQPDL